jgi:hypothetical protein
VIAVHRPLGDVAGEEPDQKHAEEADAWHAHQTLHFLHFFIPSVGLRPSGPWLHTVHIRHLRAD